MAAGRETVEGKYEGKRADGSYVLARKTARPGKELDDEPHGEAVTVPGPLYKAKKAAEDSIAPDDLQPPSSSPDLDEEARKIMGSVLTMKGEQKS